ncbi:RNA-binding protein [Candidatus Saccharibacteria bacterium]|jgi:RNA recognition motif-containing protein|nr:MAG: RNA-binding protein [Candidatus Saccharibacteria bacterium]
MNAKLYISNLSYTLTEDELREALAQYGEVTSVRIITDRETNRSRGFGFAEFANADDAKAAMDGLNGQQVGGRELRVAEAREKEDRR